MPEQNSGSIESLIVRGTRTARHPGQPSLPGYFLWRRNAHPEPSGPRETSRNFRRTSCFSSQATEATGLSLFKITIV